MSDVFRSQARTFWFAARFLPADRRQAVAGLYAFARAVDDLVDEPPSTLGPDDVLGQLTAWRGWLDRPTLLDAARAGPRRARHTRAAGARRPTRVSADAGRRRCLRPHPTGDAARGRSYVRIASWSPPASGWPCATCSAPATTRSPARPPSSSALPCSSPTSCETSARTCAPDAYITNRRPGNAWVFA